MRKVSMEKRVRMMLCTLMLMNVQKRRLKNQDRQHQIHQYGNRTLHNAYSTLNSRLEIQGSDLPGRLRIVEAAASPG